MLGFKESAQLVADYEKAGLDIVWVAEAYGFDGVVDDGLPGGHHRAPIQIGSAILPIYTRTPTLIAMTAAGLDFVSDGRFILGLGASGPQVIEGFHGVPYEAPLGRTRELIDICRMAWKREKLVHHGKYYTLPLPLGDGLGGVLGQPFGQAPRGQRRRPLSPADAAGADRRRPAGVMAGGKRPGLPGIGAAGTDLPSRLR